ncbi:hypothetical protein CYMTET_34789, partial [Cymbomonas tetramitiformis]
AAHTFVGRQQSQMAVEASVQAAKDNLNAERQEREANMSSVISRLDSSQVVEKAVQDAKAVHNPITSKRKAPTLSQFEKSNSSLSTLVKSTFAEDPQR